MRETRYFEFNDHAVIWEDGKYPIQAYGKEEIILRNMHDLFLYGVELTEKEYNKLLEREVDFQKFLEEK